MSSKIPRDEIQLTESQVLNAYGTDFGEELTGAGDRWDLETFCSELEVRISDQDDDGHELSFDIINIQAPFANALRRILIAEVPSMAIEKVYLYQNTTLIQDEVLAHRLGLIPVKADPRLFRFPRPEQPQTSPPEEPLPDPEENLVFELKVQCTWNKQQGPKQTSDPTSLYDQAHVYSKEFRWVPFADQKQRLVPAPTLVNPDILIAKLRPKQEIECRCHCMKGIGRDHAKFSPVATASYRLLPQIRLTREVTGEAARRLQESFSDGVIELVQGDDGEEKAVVGDARRDTCSRNVFRHPDLADAVLLTRKRRHFIFSVESTGALKSSELVLEACQVMQLKCRRILRILDQKLSV